MCAIYYGAFAAVITSIMINTPGDASSIVSDSVSTVTAWRRTGEPGRHWRPRQSLPSGGMIVSCVMVVLLAQLAASFALKFGAQSSEMFALILFAMTAAVTSG